MRRAPALGLAALLVLPLSGCAAGQPWDTSVAQPSAAASPARPAAARPALVRPGPPGSSGLVATLRAPTSIRTSPAGGPLTVQSDRTDEGTRQRLLVLAESVPWLQVAPPGRPNGRSGWLPTSSVDLSTTDWQLRVSLRERRLTVLRGDLVHSEHPVAVGKRATPTPTGLFFLTDLLQPPDPSGSYGPYAFGLSAYSDVVTSFGRRGRGQIGLHRTDAPDSIGTAVSSGCLRIGNETVTALARELPLGTPVRIEA